jgi:hypothetical protein
MTPILGIMASGMSGNLWAPGKDFDSIATTLYTVVVRQALLLVQSLAPIVIYK